MLAWVVCRFAQPFCVPVHDQGKKATRLHLMATASQVIQLPPITLDNCHEREDGDLQSLSRTVGMVTWDLECAQAPSHGRDAALMQKFLTYATACTTYMHRDICVYVHTYARGWMDRQID